MSRLEALQRQSFDLFTCLLLQLAFINYHRISYEFVSIFRGAVEWHEIQSKYDYLTINDRFLLKLLNVGPIMYCKGPTEVCTNASPKKLDDCKPRPSFRTSSSSIRGCKFQWTSHQLIRNSPNLRSTPVLLEWLWQRRCSISFSVSDWSVVSDYMNPLSPLAPRTLGWRQRLPNTQSRVLIS